MRRKRRTVVHLGRRGNSNCCPRKSLENGDCQRRTLQSPLERRVAPMSKVATKLTMTSMRSWDGAPHGTPVSLSWAAVGISSGIVGDPRAPDTSQRAWSHGAARGFECVKIHMQIDM